MSIIEQKITSGECVAYWDFRTRTMKDFSGDGNDGTATAAPAFSRNGLRFDGANDQVITADIDSPSALTVVALIRAESFTHAGGGNTPRMMDKVNSWRFYFENSGRFTFFNVGVSDTATLSASTLVVGKTYVLAASYSPTSGERKIYLDGKIDAEETGITGNISQDNNSVYIGDNQNNNRKWWGDIGAAMMFNSELTETEVAQVTAEINATVWPQKAYSKITTDAAVPVNFGAITSWNMKPINNIVTDVVGGNDGIVVGAPSYNRAIIGDSMYFPGAVNNIVNVPDAADVEVGTNDFSLSFWVKTTQAGSIMRIIDKRGADFGAGGIGYTVGMSATGQVIGGIGDGTTSISDETVLNTNAINDGLWHFVVAQFDRSGLARAFVDDVAGSATDISAINLTLNNVSDFHIGQQSYAAAEPFEGELAYPTLFKKIITETERQFLFDLGSKGIPFKTDWGVNESVANVTSGQIENSIFNRGSGTWKISNNTIKSDTVKTLKNIAAGTAYSEILASRSPVEAAYGTWTFWLYKGADANTSFVQFIATETGNIGAAGQDGYYVKFDGVEKFLIGKTVNGSATTLYSTSASYITINTWYRVRITRSFLGVFNFSMNGTDLPASGLTGTNPFTDTAVTEGRYFVADLDAADEISYSSLRGDYVIKTSQTLTVGASTN